VRFVGTGGMATARGGFSATRLGDGRVLVVGGVDGERTLVSAELYEPRRGRFVTAGRMALARSAHAAALLADGRVLVTGGSNDDGVTASAEIWDPRTRRFSPAGRMSVPRHKHAAVSLRDGRVLVVGGSDASDWRGRYASAEVYDPRRRRFSRTGSMRESRFKLPDAVVRLRSSDVLVAGRGTHVERYTPGAGRFSSRLPLGAALAFSTATELAGGYVLIAGGHDDRIVLTARAWFYGLP
jgi:phosphatidylserine/phosphatidylglycerophosphate/cardiolipin synthase-like enzyme